MLASARKKTYCLIFITILFASISLRPDSLRTTSDKATSGAYVYDDSNFIYLGNDFLEIQFSKNDKGAIYSFLNKLTGQDYRTDKTCYNKAWEMMISNPKSLSVYNWFDSNSYRTFSYRWSTLEGGFLLNMTYSLGPYQMDVDVTVGISSNSSLTRWRLNVDNNEPTWAAEQVHFPLLGGFTRLGDSSDDYILQSNGMMIHDLYANVIVAGDTLWAADGVRGGIYPSGGNDLQLMLLGDDLGGLYWATYDSECYAKIFRLERNGQTISLNIEHLNTLKEGQNYRMEYETVLGVFQGKYWNALSMYREWATKQWWVKNGTILERNSPEWFKQGFSMTSITSYTGSFEDGQWQGLDKIVGFDAVVQTADDYCEALRSPILLRWLGWEKYGAWISPDFFPSAEGKLKLQQTIQELHQKGYKVILGMSAGIWDIYVGDYETSGRTCTMWGRDLNPRIVVDAPRGREAACVSLASEMWRNILVNNTLQVAETGADGMQFDSWLHEPFDFNPMYEHSKGFGNWYTKELLKTLQMVKTKVNAINPKFVFASEGMTEPLLPYIDLFSSGDLGGLGVLGDKYGEYLTAIPIFSFIYRKYAVPFGGGLLDYEWQMRMKTTSFNPLFLEHIAAFSMVAGEIPEMSTFGLPNPMRIGGMIPGITFSYFSLPSDFYYDLLEFMPFATSMTRIGNMVVPNVLSSIWTSNSRTLRFLFANIGDESYTAKLDLDLAKYGLENNGNSSIFLLSGNSFQYLFTENAPLPIEVNLTVAAKSVVLLDVCPADRSISYKARWKAAVAAYNYAYVLGQAEIRGIPITELKNVMKDAQKSMQVENYQESLVLSSDVLLKLAGIFLRYSFLLNDTQPFRDLLNQAENSKLEGDYFESARKACQACNMVLSNLSLSIRVDNHGWDDPAWWTLWGYDFLEEFMGGIGYVPEKNSVKPLTLEVLEKTKMSIIFLKDSRLRCSNAEIQAILNYVAEGNNLLILLDDYSDSANPLIENFGVKALPGYVVASDHFPDNPGQFLVNFTEHPLTDGLSLVATDYAAPLRIVGNATPLAWTPKDTWTSENPQINGPFVYMACASYGLGRVVIVSEMLYMGYSTNLRIVGNAIDWFLRDHWQRYLPNIAITSVEPSTTVAIQGSTVPINVTAANYGALNDSFNLTVYRNSEVIETRLVALNRSSSKTLSFTWNTSDTPKGDYTILAEARVIPGEVNVTDNSKILDNTVTILSTQHDVAIKAVSPCRTVLAKGYPSFVNVTIKNYGSFVETFNTTLYCDANLIGAEAATLRSGESKFLTFKWIPANLGECTIKATIDVLENENDTKDNILVYGTVRVSISGDVNADGKVNLLDIYQVARAFQTSPEHSKWNSNADLNEDGLINLGDVFIVARNFGKTI